MNVKVKHWARCLLVIFVMAIGTLPGWSQSGRQIKGSVVDASGMPVVGAGVLVADSKAGTVTGADGTFSIELKSAGEARLTVTSLGYRDKTVTVPAGQSSIRIVIDEDMTVLDDVVVVAY